MKKPVIGIVPLVDTPRDSLWMVPGYMNGISEAGGLPVMLPLTDSDEDIEEILAMCDGILLTGGHDVGPLVYPGGSSPLVGETCPARDRMELKLLRGALDRDKSVFGICRGIQFMNAALGGSLWQDLPTQHPSDTDHHMTPPYDRAAHEVNIDPESPLGKLLGYTQLGVNSYHHQAVRNTAPSLSPMAWSTDGLVEAVCMPSKTFVWGVQWHPEFSHQSNPASRKLFSAFVDSAKRN